MSSQKSAKSPLTHSPSHSLKIWPWPLFCEFFSGFFVGLVYFPGGFVFDFGGSGWWWWWWCCWVWEINLKLRKLSMQQIKFHYFFCCFLRLDRCFRVWVLWADENTKIRMIHVRILCDATFSSTLAQIRCFQISLTIVCNAICNTNSRTIAVLFTARHLIRWRRCCRYTLCCCCLESGSLRCRWDIC